MLLEWTTGIWIHEARIPLKNLLMWIIDNDLKIIKNVYLSLVNKRIFIKFLGFFEVVSDLAVEYYENVK